MTVTLRTIAPFAFTCLLAVRIDAGAQEANRVAEELRREAEQFKENCGSLNSVMGCGMVVATGKPLHVSFGSIAPGNGVALGASFGTRHNPNENWRLTWSADAVRTFGGSHRAGVYMRIIRTSVPPIVIVTDPDAASPAPDLAPRPHPVINLFAQTASLQDVALYRPDEAASLASFGMTQHLFGVSTIVPVAGVSWARTLNLSVTGEAIGRFVSIRDGAANDVPGILDMYDDQSAPGLDAQPDYLQIGGGVRMAPAIGRSVRLDYLARAQQFASGVDGFSFRRWTIDLNHAVAMYGSSRPVDARDTNTPNDCAPSPGSDACPPVSFSRDRRGSLELRVLAVTSGAGDGRVPFYLQPTLGGRNVNGHASLESFDDYRFRGPHLLLLQQTFEHSVWGPIGAWVRTDQGMVAAERRDIRASALRRSVAAGLTVRAGGLPMVVVSYAVGGGEGRHVSLVINTSLLGGSNRPALD